MIPLLVGLLAKRATGGFLAPLSNESRAFDEQSNHDLGISNSCYSITGCKTQFDPGLMQVFFHENGERLS